MRNASLTTVMGMRVNYMGSSVKEDNDVRRLTAVRLL